MSKNKRTTVFSTDPEPDKPAPEVALPPDPTAPIKTLQQNQPVHVHRERGGRGGKTVSVIVGVEDGRARRPQSAAQAP